MAERNTSDGPEQGCENGSGMPTIQTGFVYDEKLLAHENRWNKDYTERPERIKVCYERMQQLGLVERCVNIPVRPATDEEVGLCHSKEHIERLKETKFMTLQQHQEFSQKCDFMYCDQHVEENARLAAGGCIDLVDSIVSGKIQNGMAVIRPPGHHAQEDVFCGYCYINNIAVAAKTAMKKHGLKKVLILDWDVHHGQGTQFMFYDDPGVMFISIHTYEHGDEWPHLRESDYDFIGTGPGKGYNINIPLNELGMENSDYLSIFFNIILPVAYEFQPELVLVSAGFDAAIGCPEGEMNVAPACFAHFINLLKPLAGGKLALLLEGGYCMKTLAESAALSLRALLGDPTPNIDPITEPKQSLVESMLNTIKVHRGIHKSLAYQDTLDKEENNYSWQTYAPPQSSKNDLRTQHNQPELYPLVQQCYNSTPPEVDASIKKKIERLEKDTVIANTAFRVEVIQYPLGPKNGRAEVSTQGDGIDVGGTLCGCQRQSASSAKAALKTALADILSDKVRSCILLPSVAGTNPTDCADYSDFIASVPVCLQNDFNINRTLYLNISTEDQAVISDSDRTRLGRSLVLSVGAAVEDGNDKPNRFHVNIPLSCAQLQDADIMAVIQQIILPLAYEFCPDFVVVCLGQLTQDMSGEGLRLSQACLAHVLTVVQGLARGRMLLLLSPDTTEHTRDLTAKCVSALEGWPCQPLKPCFPQPSTAQIIKTIQDQCRTEWKSLPLREKLPAPQSL